MNGNEQNLVTADKYFDVEISGTWSSADTTAVTVHNYTTDATRYINIYTTGSARHQGTRSTSYYRLYPSAAFNQALSVGSNYIIISGIQLGCSGASCKAIVASTATNILYDSAIIYAPIEFYTATGGPVEFRNSIMPGVTVDYFATTMALTLNNCTVYTGTVNGYRGTIVARNTYALSYAGSVTQTTCASADTTASGTALDSIAYTTSNFTDVTSGAENLHLVSGSALINVGTDLGSPYNYDIDNPPTERTGTWDIGADEYVSASVPALPSVLNDIYVTSGTDTITFN